MRGLEMDTTLSDAESRVTRLVADFHSVLDAQDMDDFSMEEPKLAAQYLCKGLRPQVLKDTAFIEPKKTVSNPLKKSVQAFIDWLTPKVQSFCFFETALTSAEKSNAQHQTSGKAGRTAVASSMSMAKNHGGGKTNPKSQQQTSQQQRTSTEGYTARY
ncbi:hypothetical protein GN958_ATG11239 [Phytophthora infestans]|uniref:Uncharacterized protein n=1 Tax=Phytophthora infestans TaxID=4787 RepID=A0A8S9ULT2_PHYIN|nr:hypothetical protein GN958_ATG11239 [Phytophthora infestans]